MRARLVPVLVWLAALLVAALVVARARFTADMSAFLPRQPTPTQQLLVEELRDGIASRLVLIAIDGGDAPTRARLSTALGDALRADPAFASVANGAEGVAEADRNFVFAHRYALSPEVGPQRFTVEGLSSAIRDSIDSLASPAGFLARDLLLADPTGETLAALEQLLPDVRPTLTEGVFSSRDGSAAVLLAETRAAGSDTDGQERAIARIRDAFARLRTGTVRLQLTGSGAFAVEARATIVHEVVRLSILSSILITALLIAAYRSARSVLLGLLPVATGALVGAAAVALGFGTVHGVTLGFGVTLIGESVDYSIYLLTQAQPTASGSAAAGWIRTLWPTVRLGLLTSLCGFASLLPSGFPGLAQLGLYSMAGLVAAALVTRFVLPALLPSAWAAKPLSAAGGVIARALAAARPYRRVLWLVPLAASALLVRHRATLWNHDLAALSPVPAAAQRLDGELRASLGAPDVRDLIVIDAADPEEARIAAETVGARLAPLVATGVLGGFDSPARYLPSAALQRERLASLPAPAELRTRLKAAVAGLPIHAERLEPFIAAVAAARAAGVVEPAALAGTSLATADGALLRVHAGRSIALLPLRAPAGGGSAPIDTARVERALGAPPAGASVQVLDLKQASDALYSDYLGEAIRLSSLGLAAIVLLLLLALRAPARVTRVMAPLALAVLTAMAGLAAGGVELTILHLIGLLLIVAVGSNYALFFEHGRIMEPDDQRATMLASLVIANLATVLGFGVLALSPVPVLAALGTTVAPGALAALVFSALMAGSREAAHGR
jgi:predicted exporter